MILMSRHRMINMLENEKAIECAPFVASRKGYGLRKTAGSLIAPVFPVKTSWNAVPQFPEKKVENLSEYRWRINI